MVPILLHPPPCKTLHVTFASCCPLCPGRFLLNGPGEACLHDQFSCGILQHLLISIQSVSSLQFLQSSSDTEKNRAGFRERAPFFPPYLACSDVTLCSSTDCLLEKHTVRTAVFCLLGKRSIRSRRSFFVSEKSVHEAMP